MNTTAERTTTEHQMNDALRAQLQGRGIEFHRNDAWTRIGEHVETHKYLLDLRSGTQVDWDQAARSWTESVMNPLVDALERHEAAEAFPKRTVGDLFFEVSDHWYFLKEGKPTASPDEAVASFTRTFGEQSGRARGGRLYRKIVSAIRSNWDRGRAIDRNVRSYNAATEEPVTYYF